jgi:hypothetical protein
MLKVGAAFSRDFLFTRRRRHTIYAKPILDFLMEI